MTASRTRKSGWPLVLLFGALLLAANPLCAQTGAGAGGTTGGAAGSATGGTFVDLDSAGYFDVAYRANLAEFIYAVRDPIEETFGATLNPVGDTLRSQLGIPRGQGLLVASLRPDGSCAQAGLKQNDILLTLADKHLASSADLTQQLKAAGEATVPLKILRGGKPMTMRVRPIYRVALGPAEEQKTEYYIGVNIEPVDEALRSQLNLPAGRGVLIGDVLADSPALKAGVLKHDIVVELGGKPMDGIDALLAQVQAGKDKPTTLKVVRGGKTVSIPITGAVRKVDIGAAAAELALFVQNDVQSAFRLKNARLLNRTEATWVDASSAAQLLERLDRLDKELRTLREMIDAEKRKKPE